MVLTNGEYNMANLSDLFPKGGDESKYVSDVVDLNEANGWGLPMEHGMSWDEILFYLGLISNITLGVNLGEMLPKQVITLIAPVLNDGVVFDLRAHDERVATETLNATLGLVQPTIIDTPIFDIT